MHKYTLVLLAQHGRPEERIEFLADESSRAFCWAERHAAGRKIEIFEDGKSLGMASLGKHDKFWTLGPASGRGPAEPLSEPEGPRMAG